MASDLIGRLRERLGEVYDLRSAAALLQWDQEVFMPPKAAPGRGQQLSTVSALTHRLFTAPEMGALLDALAGGGLTGDDAALVAETRYDFEKATKLPESFVQEFALEQSKAYEAWTGARKASDFAAFQPNLEKLVELLRRKADYFGYEDTPYDALLGEFERGMTTKQVRAIFADLAVRQSALVSRIMDSPNQPDTRWTEGEWPEDAQWAITIDVLKDMGYDFEAGRQDKSVHPFTTNFDITDVRVTTRVHPNELFSALTGSIHEGGHALYEQGFREADRRCPLGEAISLGIHESQSRMWENMIGRSLPFWRHCTPLLRRHYPGRLDGVTAEQVFAAVNKVAPSLIRVEADECTYNLHIILRFEIEVGLIEGTLAVRDVPEAWNAKVKQYLGLDVPDAARGCLQDIHWSHGAMGYFPTYALGNLYAAQMMERIEADLPALWERVGAGEFAPLLAWLREKVHRVGRRRLANELIADITGRPLSSDPFIAYLIRKYGALYGV